MNPMLQLIDQIINDISDKSNKHIDLIIDSNARVENYFSVIILDTLYELKNNQIISNYEFQHPIFSENENRKHIDFMIEGKEFKIYLEVKHLAIDSDTKKNNKRNINFYTSDSEKGRKVGVIGDIEKLDKIGNNENLDLVSLSIITNLPNEDSLNERIDFLRDKFKSKKWNIDSCNSNISNLTFMICSKTNLSKKSK